VGGWDVEERRKLEIDVCIYRTATLLENKKCSSWLGLVSDMSCHKFKYTCIK
jgi:hypothetical protein